MRISQSVLDALDCPRGELSLVLVDDPQIAKINRDHLNREGPTNVIAFPMREGPFKEISPELLGDVVISLETATVEARNGDLPLDTRFCQLLVHGVLHLLGYDHEHSEIEAARMEKKSQEVLGAVMTPNGPHADIATMITDSRSPRS